MKNLFDCFRFVSKKKYDRLEKEYRSYRNNCDSTVRVAKRCIEENHRLQDEVKQLHDILIMERNRKPKPIICNVERAYSVRTSEDVVASIKEDAVKELLLGLSEFIHGDEYKEGLGRKRFRYSIAVFPIEDKKDTCEVQE